MANYDLRIIVAHLTNMDSARSATARGRALETLVAYLFSACDGVRHYKSNVLNAAGRSEIDVYFWNSRDRLAFDFLPSILVAECKNTANRVGAAEIRNFLGKMRDMHLDHGIFVAAQGITGKANDLRAAHDTIRTAFQRDQQRLLVLTRSEIKSLAKTNDLILLMQDKILDLTVGANSFESGSRDED